MVDTYSSLASHAVVARNCRAKSSLQNAKGDVLDWLSSNVIFESPNVKNSPHDYDSRLKVASPPRKISSEATFN